MSPNRPDLTTGTDAVDSSPKIVITGGDIRKANARPVPPGQPAIPWWTATIACILAVCLPALCVFAIGVRIAIRRRDVNLRDAWNRLLCTLLIVSGLLASLGGAFILTLTYSRFQPKSLTTTGAALQSLDLSQSFPGFPSANSLDAERIAEVGKRLVFILAPDPGYSPSEDYLNLAPIGAATLLLADTNGYLLGTGLHVVNAKTFDFFHRTAPRMLLFSNEHTFSPVDVIGQNENLDLALLWLQRKTGATAFSQPIARESGIRTGEPVFAIGHPQRLFYTLSSGLVSRAGNPTLVQFSAPVSPGNSGGPLYDSFGNLLGIVSGMVDRTQSPNAENLNFAVRAEAFLNETGWRLSDPAYSELRRLKASQPPQPDKQIH